MQAVKSELGVRETLESLQELRESDGCEEDFYNRARSELLQDLITRPSVKWSDLLPNFQMILYYLFFAFVLWVLIRFLVVVIPAIFVVWLFITYILRRERIKKANWTREERLAELQRLRGRGLVTQEEYDTMHEVLMKFV